MKYENIKIARFISRPNRFIAHIEVDGKKEICHVKNTGRCRELLVPGATVFVQEVNSESRKTKYDLISVYKGTTLINIDSQAPNKIFYEWLCGGSIFSKKAIIKPETKYGSSRLDFYVEDGDRKAYIEVKGVTLEEHGVALFPDAPTERGLKHINELCSCLKEGYEAYIVFVIQMKGVSSFSPNVRMHEAFGKALSSAAEKGVKVMALDCVVTQDSIEADELVNVKIKV